MKVKEYLKKYTQTGIMKSLFKDDEPSVAVISRGTECYLTFPEMTEKDSLINMLAKHEITEVYSTFTDSDNERYPVANYGYSEKENKWYGWSHRAAYGFTTGSTCKKGDVHYLPVNDADYIQNALNFWKDKYHENIHVENVTDKGFDIIWTYTDDTPNEQIRGQLGHSSEMFPKQYGHGEWTAETMEDAKQMAIDFANNIA